MNTYAKLHISLRYFLLGKEYFEAVDALEFAHEYHNGMRKDGVTPEFEHQVRIAHYLRTLLPSLMYPQDTLTATILHDLREDYPKQVSEETIRRKFSERATNAACLLDKNGKTSEGYFSAIAEDPIASIVKGGDRMHNLQSMIGVFSTEKQLKYIREVELYFLPMLKIARRNFPRQEAAYENIKHVLTTQLELLKVINSTEEVTA